MLKLKIFIKILQMMCINGLTHKFDKNDNRLLPIGKNKKTIGKFKDELNRRIMKEFVALRAKAYA